MVAEISGEVFPAAPILEQKTLKQPLEFPFGQADTKLPSGMKTGFFVFCCRGDCRTNTYFIGK